MAKHRVAIEHINTHQIWLFDVEADDMDDAAVRGLQEAYRETEHEPYLFEVVGVWRLDVPLKHLTGRTLRASVTPNTKE